MDGCVAVMRRLSGFQAYIDGGDYTDWEGIGEKGVFTDGGVNDINNRCEYWSVCQCVSVCVCAVSYTHLRAHET